MHTFRNVLVYIYVLYTEVLLFSTDMVDNDWRLVFKIATGGNRNAFHLYTDNSTLNLNNETAKSLTGNKKEHFKSDIINQWTSVGIEKVRISVYRNGTEMAFFLFSGTGTNNTDWFSKERLLDSSYSDLKDGNTNFFSIAGHSEIEGNRIDRRFFISSNYGGCLIDAGWLVVADVDTTGNCPWEKADTYNSELPIILYSHNASQIQGDNGQSYFMNFSFDRFTEGKEDISKLFIICVSLLDDKRTVLTSDTQENTTECSTGSFVKSRCANMSLADSMGVFVKFISQSTCLDPIRQGSDMYCLHPYVQNYEVPVWQFNQTCINQSDIATQEDTTMKTETTSTETVKLKEKVEKLKKELTVNPKTTNKYKRSLTSSPDDRTSSMMMGVIGGMVIALVAGVIVFLDCVRLPLKDVKSSSKRQRKKKSRGNRNVEIQTTKL